MKIVNCKVNHIENPLGYQMTSPTFSYQVEDANGEQQEAARIQIARDADMTDIVYDTGFREDISPLAFHADFIPEAYTRYWWTVAVKSDMGEAAESDINWFESAKQEEPWQASWITCDNEEKRHPIFSKSFSPKEPATEARLYICGLGLYEASINGKKVGNELFTPYCNDYNTWLQYQTYDISDRLQDTTEGIEISVLMGNGWYKERYGFASKSGQKAIWGDEWKLIAELHILYADGSSDVIGTDESWEVTRSNIVASSIYDGEEFDATLAIAVACPAILAKAPDAPLTARLSVPVTEREVFVPTELHHTPAGETVVDIGQNIAGIFRLKVHEPKGQMIHIQFGEILQDGNFYRDNLRTAKAEYVFHSDGNPHVLEPKFTFYGYRYAKIEGVTNLEAEDFSGIAVYSEIKRKGKLLTGNPLVNRLIENAEWSQKDNFLDIPTDCPQRDERMGWTGDAQVFSPTACYLRDCYAFYRKYLYDMAEEQKTLGGLVPYTVPSAGMHNCSSVWGDAACIIPWDLYMFYGDVGILEEQFESMCSWVDYITKIDGSDRGWQKVYHFGDWLALDNPGKNTDSAEGGTDKGFISYIYYMRSAEIVAQSAVLLKKDKEAKQYKALAKQVRQNVVDDYFTVTGRCCFHTQTALVLSLRHQLSKSPDIIISELEDSFKQTLGKLQTGFVGTPLLCNVLSENGLNELAWNLLMNEEYPGWLYEVKLGATTIWERWNSVEPDGRISATGMNSLNHYAYGSIVEWIYRHAAGLDALEPGFRKARIKPIPDYRMGSLNMEYTSASGVWKISWSIQDENLELYVTVPFGCEAELTLPLAGDEIYTNKINPMFSNVSDGICYLSPGEYSVAYKTIEPLQKRLSSESSVDELLTHPAARSIILQRMPQLEMLPEDMRTRSLRQLLQEFGVPTTSLDSLDEKLLSV